MTSATAPPSWKFARRLRFERNRGLFVAIGVFASILIGLDLITPGPFSYFEFSYMSSGGTTLALLAMGEAVVVLSGGFDLSAAAVISLVNSIVATNMGDSTGSQILWSVLALLIGAAVGAVNGFFVAFLRLQSIVVTLATMFIIQGITLFVLARPGGSVPNELSTFFVGDAIPNVLPAPVLVLLVALLVWGLVKKSRFGTGIYAIGSDPEAARANGIPVVWVTFFTYVLAGAYYGAAGLFISAHTGSGDPLVGKPMLLPIFAAVVVGGTMLGGGRGGCLGPVFGAFILMLLVNVLLVLDVSPFYTTIVEGVILILAVLGATLGKGSSLAEALHFGGLKLRAWRTAGLSPIGASAYRRISLIPARTSAPVNDELTGPPWRQWITRHADALRYSLPAYGLLVVVLIWTLALYGDRVVSVQYLNSLFLLTTLLAVLGLGQGVVILTGGLDLSVPWTITLSAVVLSGLASSSDLSVIWAIPAVLLIGLLIGAFNGAGVVVFGLPPIVVTLAANGIVQGAALVYVDPEKGSMVANAPAAAIWFMDGKLFGMSPVVWFLILFVAAGTLLLSRTTFGRSIYVVGSSRVVGKLSGVGVGRTLMGVYMLSGLCSALAGILLVGLSNSAYRGMGDPFLLPAIAVVVVGGTLITGGRGHYLGIFGAALLLTALETLMSGTTWSQAVRQMMLGVVVLLAILTLRERKT
jgi:ribose transport system permease protein